MAHTECFGVEISSMEWETKSHDYLGHHLILAANRQETMNTLLRFKLSCFLALKCCIFPSSMVIYEKIQSPFGHGTLIRGVVYKELEVLSCVFLETATFSSIKIVGEIMWNERVSCRIKQTLSTLNLGLNICYPWLVIKLIAVKTRFSDLKAIV